jgi:hypothetical protein
MLEKENVMLKIKRWSPLLLAAGIVALPAWSAESSNAVIVAPLSEPELVVVEVAPPPLRSEEVPAAREGYVWAPGYWNYDGGNYVWAEGHFIPDQSGARYEGPRWSQSNGRYALRGERWIRDGAQPNPLGNARANPLNPSPGQ